MTLKLIQSPVGNPFDSFEDAERFVEVFCPAGYLYEIVEISKSRQTNGPFFSVKVRDKNCSAIGYAGAM